MQATVEPVETGAIVTQAQTLTIATHADNDAAGKFLVECKGLRQRICDNYDPIIEAAHASHKAALAGRAEHLKPLDDAVALVKGKVKLFTEEQERIRQIEQRRLEAEAQRIANEQRVKEMAEAKRLADEAKAERDRLKAIADAASASERVEAERQLKEAEAARKAAAAASRMVAAAPAPIAAPVVVAAAPKVAGMSTKKRWKAKIVDAIAIPRKYLLVDMVLINKIVTSLGAQHGVPGVEAYEETDVVIRK